MPLAEVSLLAPVERQEVWAAGVTYLRSKKRAWKRATLAPTPTIRCTMRRARKSFSNHSPKKSCTPPTRGHPCGRHLECPEPELTLVVNSRKELVGVSIGNDMSSRDIEGENLSTCRKLKMYERACAIGPCIVTGADEAAIRQWTIGVEIIRNGDTVFSGDTSINNIKRTFDELLDYLGRSQSFPHGAMLLTGTGVVPGDEFTLAAEDRSVSPSQALAP